MVRSKPGPLRFGASARLVRANSVTLPMTRRQEQTSDIDAGSTLQRKHSMPITVKRFFTDVNGTIIAKTDVVLVASGIVENYPVYLLGEFDRQGGNKTGIQNLRPVIAKPYMNFVNGCGNTSQNVVTPFSPFNTIQSQLNIGDIVNVWTDNVLAPNYFAWIVQSNAYASLASILGNLKSTQSDKRFGPLFVYELNWYALEAQWDQALHFIQSDNLGTFTDNQVQAYIFKTPFNVQEGFITVKTSFIMDQFILVAVMMEVATDTMNFNFNIDKIS